MGVFFGTDGLRGEFGKGITPEIAFRCGNALGEMVENCRILIATDSRKTGDLLALSFLSGAISVGANGTFVGILPTAGVSYITKQKGFDYGVVISASHNSAEFNGIKIFNKEGKKIGDAKERELEKKLLKIKTKEFQQIGSFAYDESLKKEYQQFLEQTAREELENGSDFSGMKIVLDTANGASSEIASHVFEELNAKVVCVANEPNGTNINRGVGVMHISNLQKQVLKYGADMGFAFDGDSDRLLAVSKDGKVVDGDQIVYIFARHYKAQGKLNQPVVVGTKHTNMGIEKSLKEFGIGLIRTDVGDKYVSEALEENNLLIGGEQSGHVFVCDKLQTGDGILNALLLTCICANQNQSLEKLAGVKKFHQKNVNVKVENKEKVLQHKETTRAIDDAGKKIGTGRVMVRASGTEPVIRIMTESENDVLADFVADELEKLIKKIDSRSGLCVE